MNRPSTTVHILQSNSMFPVLRRGDELVVQATSPEELARNTIVVFRGVEHLVAHRIRKNDTKQQRLITAGDVALRNEAVPYTEVVGIVVGLHRNGHLLSLPECERAWLTRLPRLFWRMAAWCYRRCSRRNLTADRR